MGPVVPTSVISFRSVVALVDRFPVLAGADLEVSQGECVLVTGANGAGKTSLLRAVAALLPITSGSATVLGFNVTADRRDIRRSIGYLSHSSALYSELTVKENVTFAVRAAGGNAGDVLPALQRFGLDGRLSDVSIQRVSAGQRRRTALAALVARRPPLWLLDEPHTGLDIDTRAILDDVIAHAVKDGTTVMFSSHEGSHPELASRAITIAGGLVEGGMVSVSLRGDESATKVAADVS